LVRPPWFTKSARICEIGAVLGGPAAARTGVKVVTSVYASPGTPAPPTPIGLGGFQSASAEAQRAKAARRPG